MSRAYNYEHFLLDEEENALFANFPTRLPAGSQAPDGTLVEAASGDEVELSALWKRNHVLIEFGSFT